MGSLQVKSNGQLQDGVAEFLYWDKEKSAMCLEILAYLFITKKFSYSNNSMEV